MNNNFRNEMLMVLDNKYDAITYSTEDNILEVTINKKLTFKDLDEIIKDLSKEVMYPLLKFVSTPTSYTFTYRIRQE